MAQLTDEEYCDWLMDTSRDNYRVFLIEADHAAGAIYLGSRAFLSDANVAYDDWLITSPYLESSVNSVGGLGDFDATNQDPDDNWTDHVWNHQECRWYFGDSTWLKEDFRQIGAALIDECRPMGQKRYQFNLKDSGHALDMPIDNVTATKVQTVAEAIDWVTTQTGISIEAINVPEARMAWDISYNIVPSTTVTEVVKGLARSLNAKVRVSAFGTVAIVVPSTSTLTLTVDDILSDLIPTTTMLPAYASVTVIESVAGTRHSDVTNANTGHLSDDIEIETYLTLTANATEILAEYISWYANHHHVYSIPISEVCDVVTVGDTVTVVHPDLTDSGFVSSIRRSLLMNDTEIEVTV